MISQQCLECDSKTDSDESCSYSTISEPAIKSCEPFLGCFTEIYRSQNEDYTGYYTRRGCLSQNQVCTAGSSTCEPCTTQNCNNKLFPTNRPKCLKCSGGDCLTAKSEYCRVLLPENNECVTLFDDGMCFVNLKNSLLLQIFIIKYRRKSSPPNLLF